MFLSIIKQELRLSSKKIVNSINPLVFFVIVISIFNLILSDNFSRNSTLQTANAGNKLTQKIISKSNHPNENEKALSYNIKTLNIFAIWFCLIFSIILGSNNFAKQDFEDGSLEQLLLSGNIFSLIIATKIFAHWLIYSSPIILIIPLIIIILGLEANLILYLVLLASIVTMIVNLITCFAASLVLSNKTGSMLLTILVMPLIVPIIIFANCSLFSQESFLFSLKILIALLVFLFPILASASAVAIKVNLR